MIQLSCWEYSIDKHYLSNRDYEPEKSIFVLCDSFGKAGMTSGFINNKLG